MIKKMFSLSFLYAKMAKSRKRINNSMKRRIRKTYERRAKRTYARQRRLLTKKGG